MEILGSTIYVNLKEQKDHWYQLSVTNQWDFSTKSICSSTFKDGFVCYYHLKINTPVSENQYKSETVTEITDEIKKVLSDNGYNVF